MSDKLVNYQADLRRRQRGAKIKCKLCGTGVTAKDPERYPYCLICHYTGAAASDIRKAQLQRMRQALGGIHVHPVIWHTGGGCFMLAIRFAEDPGYYCATDGNAGLPHDDDGYALPEGGWGYVAYAASDEDEDPTMLLPLQEGGEASYSDEQVLAAIREHRDQEERT